eukprot:CAMPEP_0197688028 /NCGR_PEP_ID=MMETSP1338-20131121/104800_1 /TAXON_ID=43686 ORGANISM="Pelagodinium beii, Strain RCC1491" /NCGR_SAMPLE_ID=MMETSP1338 /ASSEMBLY_ACC=CAM_ASM_000754 /LENGTH=144 /DNA_ID=CAMNT_0043270195 /DNA_START=12 /DNA_END=443 /DNA_ORIENTATION=+
MTHAESSASVNSSSHKEANAAPGAPSAPSSPLTVIKRDPSCQQLVNRFVRERQERGSDAELSEGEPLNAPRGATTTAREIVGKLRWDSVSVAIMPGATETSSGVAKLKWEPAGADGKDDKEKTAEASSDSQSTACPAEPEGIAS